MAVFEEKGEGTGEAALLHCSLVLFQELRRRMLRCDPCGTAVGPMFP